MKRKCFSIALMFIFAISIAAQTSEFTYQGKLVDAEGAAGSYDFEFRLCASETADCSTPLAVETKTGVALSNGTFTVKLNFGSTPFDGADRFLEIAVRRAGQTIYTVLAPRQKLTSAPYAIQTRTANDTLQLGGRAANQYVLTSDPRLSATNYVQNGTTAQTGVNFNVGGTGTANVLNAATQFNLGGTRFLSGSNIANVFAGKNAGQSNSTGDANSFSATARGN